MLEIIALVVQNRVKINGTGVQATIDAIVAGRLNEPKLIRLSGHRGVLFAEARADVLAKLSPSGRLPASQINKALKVIYNETHDVSAEVNPIELNEGDYTPAEAIAIMSVFLFIHRLIRCNLDIAYTSKHNQIRFKLSQLP